MPIIGAGYVGDLTVILYDGDTGLMKMIQSLLKPHLSSHPEMLPLFCFCQIILEDIHHLIQWRALGEVYVQQWVAAV